MPLAVEKNRSPVTGNLAGGAGNHMDSGKQRLMTAMKRRRARQVLMGAVFLILLGGGWFFPLTGYFIPLCMVAGVGLASFRGRAWCNWYCPRGSFADIYMKTVSPGRRIPDLFRGRPLRAGVLAFLMAMLAFQITRLWPDYIRIGGFFMVLLTITTAIGLAMAMAFHQRTWCYLCPIGTISNWVGRKRYALTLAQEKCEQCNVCAKGCPMQLKPFETDEQGMKSRGDCLKCGLCITACPKGALSFDA